MNKQYLTIYNAQEISISDIPCLSITDFRQLVCTQVANGRRLLALFCRPTENQSHWLYGVLADDQGGRIFVTSSEVDNEFPSLTPDCLQAHLFEREIFETYGIRPKGHPWLKPVRFPRDSCHPSRDIGDMDFFEVEGEEIHEVAVGPVHAGVIEPGHFRFQCHGEKVFHLEISLGYQHRGVLRAIPQASSSQRNHLIETASGDTTSGHTLAYCNVLEALADYKVPSRAQAVRGIALELERIACHIGDLGALAGDAGFLPTSSYCGRIRGVVLNMTAALCGNRFSRGLIRPGGVAYDIDNTITAHLLDQLERVQFDATNAIELLWDTPSVLGRFEGTGIVSTQDARALGLVGPAGRASGLRRDVRHDYAHGIFQFQQIPIALVDSGDVLARAKIRWLETLRSFTFVREMLLSLPESETRRCLDAMKPNRMSFALVEGWRGEICHIGITDSKSALIDYRIIDPSFHNWFGLAYALRNEAISDFPLCNKSFNLSYCGFDL